MSEVKKLSGLDEVRADAEFNYLKQLQRQKQDEAYEAAKANGDVDSLESLKAELLGKESKKETKEKQ